MPVELLLRPVMRPIVYAQSIIMGMHRRSSRYIPHYIDIDESKATEYAYRKRFGTGSKIWDVYETTESKMGPTEQGKALFWFSRSRAVKGAYKMYSREIMGTGPKGEDEPVATVRAGITSNVLLIRAPDVPASELGWHVINHKVDATDAYRMFTLANGATYQWSSEGKFLEKVMNVGEKESEVRKRIGQVIPAGPVGFNLVVDESEIPRELALATALASWVDQWNTNLHYGGIYWSRQPRQYSWKRD